MKSNILIVGGSYAGLAALHSIKQTLLKTKSPISVTLIEPKSGFLNILGIPRCIIDRKFAAEQYIPFKEFLKFDTVISDDETTKKELTGSTGLDLRYIQGKVISLTPTNAAYKVGNTEGGMDFDYVILATGRDRNWPISPEAVSFESYLKEIDAVLDKFKESDTISLIGGGAVGIEISSELKTTFPDKTINLIHPHGSLPPEPVSDKFKSEVLQSLKNAKVNVLLNTRVQDEQKGKITTTVGDEIESDLNIWTNSHSNNLAYLSDDFEKFITSKNDIKTNGYLQTFPNVFVVGDLMELLTIKSAGWAIHTSIQAATNVLNSINGEPLIESKVPFDNIPAHKLTLVGGDDTIIHELNNILEINPPKLVEEYKTYRLSTTAPFLGITVNSP